jgi:hypothetical protein
MLHCSDRYGPEVSGVVFEMLVILMGFWCDRIGFGGGQSGLRRRPRYWPQKASSARKPSFLQAPPQCPKGGLA